MVYLLGMPVNMAAVWLVAVVAFLVIEALVPGLVSLWFAIGALAALLSAALGAPMWLQLIWFFVVSIAALLLTRPLVKKFVNGRVQPTNADSLIGKECVVTEDIDNIRSQGAVKIRGMEWTARAEKDSDRYAVGDVVSVAAIEGVKLIVR